MNSPHKTTNNNTQGTASHANTPTQNRTKAGGVGGTPGSTRQQTRRRDTADERTGGNPFNGSPAPMARRRTDLRDGDEISSPSRDRSAYFGRWGSTPGADSESKEPEENNTGSTRERNTGLFRRPSAAWGSSSSAAPSSSGFGQNGTLNSPMGTFGNGAFGGGAMGGFLSKVEQAKKGPATSRQENVDERSEDGRQEAVSNTIADLRDDDSRRPMTGDTDPFGLGDHDEQGRDQRSNVIDQDRVKASSPFGEAPSRPNAIGTPTRQRSEFGFSAFGGSRDGFGMTSLQTQLQNLQFNQQGQVPLRRSREGSLGGALAGDNEPLSPAETNPFTSPPPEKNDDHDNSNDSNEGGGLGSVIAGLRRGEGGNIAQHGSDRSGRSSTAGLGSVGGTGLGGFGGLGGGNLWGGSAQIGTPGLGSAAGQSSFFNSGPLTSDGFSTPGGSGLLSGGLGGLGGLSGFGSASRSSRLGLFTEPQHHDDQQGFESEYKDPRFEPFGSRSRLGGGMDSPMRERGGVTDLFGFPSTRSIGNLAGAAAAQDAGIYRQDGQDTLGGIGHQAQQASPPNPQAVSQSGQPIRPPPGNLPMGTVPHVLLMPDKIMWEYRDPTGTIQGPFSGLEMHEWYRAGFFTQELAVKRVDDSEFVPLGSLVRRIGNTREPFLVPLPGSSAAGMSTVVNANWSESRLNDLPVGGVPAQTPQPAATPGSIQPPFAGSFPTFGTTLTAEQQNALERRKQEEQYLMAKQREFLLQQQMLAKAQLHHQSSTKSLHSQTSFGSLHSPNTFGPTPSAPAPVLVGGQNSFEPGVLLRQAGAAAGGQDALNLSGMQTPGVQFPQQGAFPQQQQPQLQQQQSQQSLHLQHEQQRLAEHQRQQQLQRNYQTQQTAHVEKQLQQAQEAAQLQHTQQQQQQGHVGQHQQQPEQPAYIDHSQSAENLREQAQGQATQAQQAQVAQQAPQDQKPKQQPVQETVQQPAPVPQQQPAVVEKKTPAPVVEAPKPAPVPKVPSVKSSPAPTKPAQPAWGAASPLVAPFPPPPGVETPTAVSPLIEPAAPSIAPWAKEAETPSKTPSLKEIQDAEAKEAAAREAEQARIRAEMLAAQPQHIAPPPAPGLPSTATWATSPSTTPAASGASAWNKPLAGPATPGTNNRKTLQQIQKEEEALARKQKAAAASQLATVTVSTPGGKRYADLASKPATSQPTGLGATTGSAWTTVGPSGKVKPIGGTPTATSTAPAAANVKSTASTAVKKSTSATPAKPVSSSAQEEFNKWCRASVKFKDGVNRKPFSTPSYPHPTNTPHSRRDLEHLRYFFRH